jgi:hypothetical protein
VIQDRANKIILAVVTPVLALFAGLKIAKAPDDTTALLTFFIVVIGATVLVARVQEDRRFVIRLWLIALAVRFLIAGVTYYFNLRGVIAPDYDTYDNFGNELYRYWIGQLGDRSIDFSFTKLRKSGWGFYYFVAAVYYIIGRNAFAFQLICSVIGAAAVVLIHQIAYLIYPHQRTARLAGVITALSPSMILWTSQGIKEGPIMFLLCLSLYLTMRMSRKIRLLDALLLLVSLFCLFSLRHYVFYVVFVAVGSSLIVAVREFSAKRMLQGGIALVLISFFFVSLCAREIAENNLNMKKIQAGRKWSARVSSTGYGGDVDITDTQQALAYLPIGTLYFLYAPFPWMISSVSQLLTLPELILWWLLAPLLFTGYWYAVRHRLPESFAIGFFTLGLTLVYALYQTNAGTAHRQRVQLLGFFIIFVSIGWERWRARRSERRAVNDARRYGWERPTPGAGPIMSRKPLR